MSTALISLLAPVATTLVLAGLAYAKGKLSEIKNEKLRDATWELMDVVEHTVRAANQTAVAAVKKTAKSKIGKEEAKAIKDVVVAQVVATLSAEAQKVLEKEFGNLELKVDNLVESSVYSSKKN